MPGLEPSELNAYLEELIAATRAGSIVWARVNPSTFAWDTQSPVLAKVILQQVERRVPPTSPIAKIEKQYVFQVFDMGQGQQRLSLNGADDPLVNQKLDYLFESISSELSRRDLDFLKSLLPPKPRG